MHPGERVKDEINDSLKRFTLNPWSNPGPEGAEAQIIAFPVLCEQMRFYGDARRAI